MMLKKLAKKQINLVKKPLDLLYGSKKIKRAVDKTVTKTKGYIPLDLIYKEKNLITYLFGNQLIFLSELVLTFILTEAFHIWYMFSYGISLAIGLAFMFLYHKYITFSIKDTSYKHFIPFSIIMIFSFVVSWELVYLITTSIPLHYIIVIILVSIPVSILSYKFNKRFVFKIRWQDELFEDL